MRLILSTLITYDTTVTDNSGLYLLLQQFYLIEIPRIRICRNVRMPGQDYFIINDIIGFTIQQGTNRIINTLI